VKTKWVAATAFLAFLSTSCGSRERTDTGNPTLIRGVKTELITMSTVEEEYEAVGTVHSKTTSVLSSKSVGDIVAVHVREGNRVAKGMLLIEIDDRAAAAQLLRAQAALREVTDSLGGIDQEIRAAEAARDAAQTGKALALVTFNRYKDLFGKKSISPQEMDEVEAKYKVAEAEVNRTAGMLQSLIAKKSQVQSKVEQMKAEIAAAQINESYSRILSPLDGIVTSRQAEIGLLAAPGVPLLTLEDNSRYRLEVSVEDSMLGKINSQTPVRVVIDALGPQELLCRVNELLLHMLIAVVSVSALIGITLGLRESGIVALAIPVTLALTLAVVYLYGYTLNRVTLFALIFSIGILVDDAIVVMENIVRHYRLHQNAGRPITDIAIEAVGEVGNPTILASFTVIAAILPMAFVGGLMGPYMRPIPVGASAAMIFSLAVAFIVTPWASVRLLRRRPRPLMWRRVGPLVSIAGS
jgi:multidrug resistance efflux pump